MNIFDIIETDFDKYFFNFKHKQLFQKTEPIFLYARENNRFVEKQEGARFFNITKDEYAKHERDFLENYEKVIQLLGLQEVANKYGIEIIERQLGEDFKDVDLNYYNHWEDYNKFSFLLDTISPITNPIQNLALDNECKVSVHDFLDGGQGFFCQIDDFAFEKFRGNLIVDFVKPGSNYNDIEYMSLPINPDVYNSQNTNDIDSCLSMSEFFFKYFVYNNILASISNIFYNHSLLKDTDYISTFKNPIQRVYTLKDNPLYTKILKKIADGYDTNYFDFIEKYLQIFGLGTSLEIKRNEEGLGTHIYIIDKGRKTLLADMGYGISQVLPLIFQIILAGKKNEEMGVKLFVEEPEANLHPALQSKLADMFVDAANQFNIQFIIETHSEYLIRRLQVLTANTYTESNKNENWSELKTNDTQLYYFYQADAVPEGEEQVYKINIEEDGALTKNFGTGFFDVSSKWNIALYSYTKANKN